MLPVYLTTLLLVLSPVQGLPLLPAVFLGILGVSTLFHFRSIPEKPLYLLLLLNYAYWGISLVLRHNMPEIFSQDFIRWQLRGFFSFLPLMAWLAMKSPLTIRDGKIMVLSFFIPATLVALSGVFVLLFGAIPELSTDIEFSLSPVRRVVGKVWFFGLHRSHLAAGGFYLSVCVLLASLLIFWENRKASAVLFPALLINLWALSFTKARTFIVAYVVALVMLSGIAFLIRQRVALRRVFTVSVVSLFFLSVLVLVIPGFAERFLSTENLAQKNVSDRIVYWKAAIEMIKESPIIGVGLGNFTKEFRRLGYALSITPAKDLMMHAHNTYLHIAAETGLVGISLFLGLIALMCWKLYSLFLLSRWSDSFRLSTVIGALTVVVAQSVAALVDHNFWSPTIMLPVTALVGIALSLKPVAEEDGSSGE